MANDEPAEQEHFTQIPEGQPIAQTAENHEADDVARKGPSVQHSATALVELPTAIPAAKPLVALSRDLPTLRNRRRATADTSHLEIRTAPAASSPTKFTAEVNPPPGARPDRTPCNQFILAGHFWALDTLLSQWRGVKAIAWHSSGHQALMMVQDDDVVGFDLKRIQAQDRAGKASYRKRPLCFCRNRSPKTSALRLYCSRTGRDAQPRIGTIWVHLVQHTWHPGNVAARYGRSWRQRFQSSCRESHPHAPDAQKAVGISRGFFWMRDVHCRLRGHEDLLRQRQ